MEKTNLVSRRARRWYRRSSSWLMFLIPIAVFVTSCGKQVDSGRTETALPVQASDHAPSPEPSAAATPPTDVAMPETPKASVMKITYQTQSTPNQFVAPGMRVASPPGEEIRYLDLANHRMRVEKYVLGNSGKRLHQTTIIDQTGSYRFAPEKNEAFFVPMKTPVPVWNFDQNINTKWARERGLTVTPGKWLDRTCEIVSHGSGNNVWLWNEIPLKKEQKQIGSETIISAWRIQENASIEASMLQLPAGMEIKSATGAPKTAMKN